MLKILAEKLSGKGFHVYHLPTSGITYIFHPNKKAPKRFTSIVKAETYLKRKVEQYA